jgi:hypothetical protein
MILAAPELEFVRRQHVVDHHEILPHVLLGDVTRWIVAHHPQARLLAVLEHHLSTGGEEVRNVIAVSFLENLEKGEPADERVRRALGPQLRAALESMESWSPPSDFDLHARLALSVERQTVKMIRDGRDRRRVEIFRRQNGTYGFTEWRWDSADSAWTPFGRYAECVTDSPERAESEARSRVAWLANGPVNDA